MHLPIRLSCQVINSQHVNHSHIESSHIPIANIHILTTSPPYIILNLTLCYSNHSPNNKILNEEQELTMTPEIRTIEQTYICLVCHQLFYEKQDLVKHFSSSHEDGFLFLRRADDDNLEHQEHLENDCEEQEQCTEHEHKVVDVFWPRFC
ncbi:hypothetical protein BDZ45DRAFT_45198 [Acephala macrosclerotiorum]|nr:hypothetical protein BDZ45DRAFT_45198 [Acephala macrosclerotiorum]